MYVRIKHLVIYTKKKSYIRTMETGCHKINSDDKTCITKIDVRTYVHSNIRINCRCTA